MLSEERFEVILKLLEEKNTVTVNELVEKLNTSESTIRRDLNHLDKEKKLKKVHGGATSLNIIYDTKEDEVLVRQSLNVDDKSKIAKYAASLIEENDFVYIDAGTTTELMIDYITQTKASYITNGIVHAKKLLQKKCNVYIIGGEIKLSTEAIVGIEAIDSLKKYNWTNGVDIKSGFTTPDIKEALIKREALNRSKEGYILADKSKFNHISSVTFGEINKGIIITTQLEEDKYRKYAEVLEAK